MSKAGFDKAIEVLSHLVQIIAPIAPDIGAEDSCVTSDVEEDSDNGTDGNDEQDGGVGYGEQACEEPMMGDDPVDGKCNEGTNLIIGVKHKPGRKGPTVPIVPFCPDPSQNTFLVGDGVNLEPSDKAKTKGRTIPTSEVREVKLGAKGTKKNKKTCFTCGIACGHDSRTCTLIPINKHRLDAVHAPKRRGRPPGAKNRTKSPAVGDDAHPGEIKKGTMGPRRRGRPSGTKNKV